jgi:hypothetical protein
MTANNAGVKGQRRELLPDDAGGEIRIASFVPWAAIRRIKLRA